MRLDNILFLAIIGLNSLPGLANEKTDQNWDQQMRSQKLEAKDQSYCYTDDKGHIQGANVDMRIRLASVSKLLISLWSVEKLGIDYKYNTKLYIKGNNLHIAGSFDPFLGNEKMFFLISQLNELGYSNFDTITFDKNLMIFPEAAYLIDEYPVMNSITNARHLKTYFNTNGWSAETKSIYDYYRDQADEGRFKKEVNFKATNVKFVDVNPFERDSDVRVLTLSSPPIHKYLKEVNVKSNNYVSETIFRQLGGESKFEEFLADRFSLTADKIHFYSGSGLPTFINKVRKDNYATCSVMLDLISELKEAIEKQNKTLEDLVAVPGSDRGTFRNRIFPSDFKNSFVAKTGTLMHTSALAGVMNTQKGFSFFGVFNQSTDIVGSKIVQNSMVGSIMGEMGGPLAFDYTVQRFFPYNNDSLDGMKFNGKISDPEKFTSIEEGLF